MAALTIETARSAAEEFLSRLPPYPEGKHNGRGIVICAGGSHYFTCAWVCIKILRLLGCDLPIELWQLSSAEIDNQMRALVTPLGVTCIDASSVRKSNPVRTLNRWELKPFSIIHSRFADVLFLDADNVPVINPEFLFETQPYKDQGAIFWPDFARLEKHRMIWGICGVEFRDEPEFETGQIVIDKRRSWLPLNLTMHLNEHSDFYYQYIHGDKETFHIAWRMRGQDYAMVAKSIHALPGVICQHDFQGRRIFQHRNLAKWDLNSANRRIAGFDLEDECFGFLSELRHCWDGKVGCDREMNAVERAAADEIIREREFRYIRLGYDQRRLEFLPQGKVGAGRAKCEENWLIEQTADSLFLVILGRQGETCRLQKQKTGAWMGRWIIHECMPVELHPVHRVASRSGAERQVAELSTIPKDAHATEPAKTMPPAFDPDLSKQLAGRFVTYHRVGFDTRPLLLAHDGQVGEGIAGMERQWGVRNDNGKEILELYGDEGLTARLERDALRNWMWRGQWLMHERMEVELSIHRAQVIADLLANTSGAICGAEVGVYRGETSSILLRLLPNLTLLMVDWWTEALQDSDYAASGDNFAHKTQSEYDSSFQQSLIATDFARDRRIVLCADQFLAARYISDHSLDFIFLDGDHSYSGTRAAISCWLRKLKPGGFVCGHDYRRTDVDFGVDRAVRELAISLNSEPLSLSDHVWALFCPDGIECRFASLETECGRQIGSITR